MSVQRRSSCPAWNRHIPLAALRASAMYRCAADLQTIALDVVPRSRRSTYIPYLPLFEVWIGDARQGVDIVELLKAPSRCFEKTPFLARIPVSKNNFSRYHGSCGAGHMDMRRATASLGPQMALCPGQGLENALLRRAVVNGEAETMAWCLEWTRGSQRI